MKNRPIRKVSFKKGLQYGNIQSFRLAFPHLTPEEAEHYFPAVSYELPAKAKKEKPSKPEAPADEVKEPEQEKGVDE